MTDIQEKFKEYGRIWQTITQIWRDEVASYPKLKMTPADFLTRLLKENTMDELITVFGIIAVYKTYDGRIYDENRRFLSERMDPELRAEVVRDYSVIHGFFTGLDDIHTAHIDQAISAIRKTVLTKAK